MQGFNKYYPPSYFDDQNHEKGSLNSFKGTHALGVRAKKIDQGILITRFELPFNIWCGTCNNHIGMGVRYNAEKKKIGAYYSTAIFSFRCKCHLCSGWFEVQTDPKNTRYIVTEGARRQEQDWDPAENGGYSVKETDPDAPLPDALESLEKTTTANTLQATVTAPRIESLAAVSEHYNADPYTLSTKIRKRFREDKKVDLAKKTADDGIRGKYGLPETLKLIEDDEASKEDAKSLWDKGRMEMDGAKAAKRRKLDVDVLSIPSYPSSRKATSSTPSSRRPSSSDATPSSAVSSLRARLLQNTARQSNLFAAAPSSSKGRTGASLLIRKK